MRLKIFDWIAIGLTALYALVGSIVSVVRYWQYDAYYIDFGIFDQAIWKVAHFQAPVIEHFIVGGKVIFADHFNPSIFLLSPLYWFTDRSEVILIAQAVAVALSGFVLYKIAQHVTKHNFWSLTILLCYFLFVGLQNAVITEFHEITVMTLALSLLWWAAIKKKKILYFIMLFITLGFKEALFPLGVGIGVALFFLQKEWRKIAIATILISLAWGFAAINYIIPYFSQGIYIYSPNLPESIQGKIVSMVDQPEKRQTLFYSFASFGFLPLFSPAFWLAMLQDYALRFLPEGFHTRWGLGLHYNAQSAVLLALAAIYSIRMFLNYQMFKKYSLVIGGILIFLALVLNSLVLHGPFHLVYNKAFYAHTNDVKFLDALISNVPKDASVMTQNNLAGHFTHQEVYLLRAEYHKYAPEYIVVDIRDGQGPTNFFGSTGSPKDIVQQLQKDPQYEVIYQTAEQFVFQRKENSR